MTKIWLKIWLKVKENGAKKNQIGENGGERNPSANPDKISISKSCLLSIKITATPEYEGEK